MKDQILQLFNLSDEKIPAIFPYGSYVYGTASPTSDRDFILICQEGEFQDEFAVEKNNFSIHLYNPSTFQNHLNQHKISALECCFLPKHLILKENITFSFNLKLDTLRRSISEKSSHSWVKAKKKFEVEKDRNVYIAKKSLFHSLRIIDFGIQIVQHQKIVNYNSCNTLWEEIYTNPSEQWDDYKKQYQEYFNHQMTEFRKLAPK